jgi:perosamine synthetase
MQTTKNIPMAAPILGDTEAILVNDVLRSGKLAQGATVEEFERCFARYTGTRYAVAVNSGTAALHVALLAAGIGPGDEVITTPFTFVATANAILFCGARPVFADIEPETFNISPEAIKQKITAKTRAVIVVHLYGQPCDMDAITELCRDNHLDLIEDACQAHGAEYRGRKAGSFGIGCFSFYPTKNMTTGEGGMITTDDAGLVETMRMLRSHGQRKRYVFEILGFNYRMTEMAAAIGIAQLARLDTFNLKRVSHALYLSHYLNMARENLPIVAPNRSHVFHQYTIRSERRDQLAAYLASQGVGIGIYYPVPLHKQPLYVGLGYHDSLPVAEQAAREVLSLPVHPSLTEDDIERIIEVANRV